MKVYRIAKELGIPAKDVIRHLRKMGVAVKNRESTVDEETFRQLESELASSGEKLPDKPEGKATADREGTSKGRGKKPTESLRPREGGKERTPAKRKQKGGREKAAPEAKKRRSITVMRPVTVGKLADSMDMQANQVIAKLLSHSIAANINQNLDDETAKSIAREFNFDLQIVDLESTIIKDEPDRPEDLQPRPPVVTIMGHVDHGKTSLLDIIHKSDIAAQEVGGITQHIGAYDVSVDGKHIVFIDTPGHEAFTAMRARGAHVTDIVVLVVAADDGVMPQTIEAINHARAANVPIIVAINKIDKENADPDRVRKQLADHGLLCEEWGGDTITVPVSAKEGTGVDTLLEMILLQAEILELKANPKAKARGTIIESKLDRRMGPIATVLINKGTLRVGDFFVAGNTYGKVRTLIDDKGRRLKEATPSMPVEVLGFSDVPQAGDKLIVVPSEKDARRIYEHRQDTARTASLRSTSRVTLEDLYQQIREGSVKDLNIIVKGDTHGTVEVLNDSLTKLSNDEVKIQVIHSGIGSITESDVMLASASNAIIIGFDVRPEISAQQLAENEGVSIEIYNVIYDLIDDIKAAVIGMLEPKYKEVSLGRAEVREIFKVSKVGTVAGCYVTDGKIVRNANVRLIRDDNVVYEGKVKSLKRFKDDAREVTMGLECGVGLENFDDIKVQDIIEVFTLEEVKR
ncbi:MAG: translation initiation factor IF-2 [bacterium]